MKKIVGLFLILFSINGHCQWTLISTSDDGLVKSYMDVSTKKNVGGYVRVWSLIDINIATEKNRSYVALVEHDCTQDRRRTLQVTVYAGQMGGGTSRGTEQGDLQWNYITPGTLEARGHRILCAK